MTRPFHRSILQQSFLFIPLDPADRNIKITSPYLRYKVNIMKKSFLGALLSLGLLSAAHADKFDNTHTNAVFNIDHFQTSTNHGGFMLLAAT